MQMGAERGELREALVAAALTMLESGAGELSLRGVARAAGVSAMAPYRHFADKAALLAAVAERGFTALRQHLLAADTAADPHEALLGQGLAYIAFARTHPALFRLMFADQPGLAKPADDNAVAYDVLSRRVRALVPGDPEGAALACWSIVHGMATLALDGRLPGVGTAQERRALSLFVTGLGRPAGGSS